MTDDTLVEAIAVHFLPHPPEKIGVAVSGGGDSMALLVSMASMAKGNAIEIHAISIDHGLRKDAQIEINLVKDLCASLGVPHHVEKWSEWDGVGNLQGTARAARYELISKWAQRNGITTVALGHTANDQAETVLMRLARGAGVDGLASMATQRLWLGIKWVRPLLNESRDSLRDFLRQNNVTWAEDPSNENRDFTRIKMRDALEVLEPLGITVQSLSSVASNMADARAALDWHTFLAAKEACEIRHGVVQVELKFFRTLPLEIGRRLLVRAIMWVTGSEYSPRHGAVSQVQRSIKKGVSATLDGCQVTSKGTHFYVFREFNAVRNMTSEVSALWDGRWHLTGPEEGSQLQVRPLGEDGLKQVGHWRDLGLPRGAVLSLPAVWRGDDLVSTTTFFAESDWDARLERGADTFFATLLSH